VCDEWDNDFKKFSSAEHHALYQLSSRREALCIQLAISLSRSTFPFPLLSSLRGAPCYQSAIFGATLNKIIASKIVAHVALCYQQVAAHSSIPVLFSLAIFKREAPCHLPAIFPARSAMYSTWLFPYREALWRRIAPP
jgi:hypothetical protein